MTSIWILPRILIKELWDYVTVEQAFDHFTFNINFVLESQQNIIILGCVTVSLFLFGIRKICQQQSIIITVYHIIYHNNNYHSMSFFHFILFIEIFKIQNQKCFEISLLKTWRLKPKCYHLGVCLYEIWRTWHLVRKRKH